MSTPLLDPEQIAMLRDIPGETAPTLLEELLDLFFSTSSATLVEMQDAVDKGEVSRVSALAHSLKGSSGNLGAISLQNMASEMEAAAKGGTNPGAESLQRLKDEFEKTRIALEKERAPAS